MKSLLKRIARGLACIAVSPLFMVHKTQALLCDERTALRCYSQFLSLLPGTIGDYLRLAFYRMALEDCPASACIGFGTIFSTPKVCIGENVYIGLYCIIGESEIGDDAIIGSRVSILSGLRQHSISLGDAPIREQAGVFERMKIGRDTWIGEGAIIGAHVEDGAVVGAGSVLVKPAKAAQIYAGNPAIFVKDRPQ
jgi:acetyltransferase-like isoleucine patch superfamily enzyme